MERSEQIGQLAAALAKAQSEIKSAIMDSAAVIPGKEGRSGYSYRYADLASVTEACRGPLSKNGIAVIQTAENGQGVSVRTMLAHASGEWIASTLTFNPGQTTPQAIGSAITYARRYGLAAICGVVQEDDDGQEASKPDPREAKRQREVAPKPPSTPTTGPKKDDVINAIIDWLEIDRAGTASVIALIKKAMGVEGQLQPSDFPEVLTRIAELKRKGVTKDTLADALKPAAPADEEGM